MRCLAKRWIENNKKPQEPCNITNSVDPFVLHIALWMSLLKNIFVCFAFCLGCLANTSRKLKPELWLRRSWSLHYDLLSCNCYVSCSFIWWRFMQLWYQLCWDMDWLWLPTHYIFDVLLGEPKFPRALLQHDINFLRVWRCNLWSMFCWFNMHKCYSTACNCKILLAGLQLASNGKLGRQVLVGISRSQYWLPKSFALVVLSPSL